MARTRDTITEEMRADLNNAGMNIVDFNTSPVAMTILDSTANQVEQLELMAAAMGQHFYISSTEAEYLDKRAAERGLTRDPGEKASGFFVASRSTAAVIGSLIPAGTQFEKPTDHTSYVSTADVTLQVGETSAIIPVQCSEVGIKGNATAGTAIKQVGIAITEVETIVVGPYGIINGRNPETDDSLRQRIQNDMQKTPTSNNKSQLIKWAKEVKDTSGNLLVGDAQVQPLWDGDNTAKVYIIDLNKQPASAATVDAVQEYIDPGITGLGDGVAAIGLFVTVEAAAGINIDVAATLILKSGYTLGQINAAFATALTEYLKSIAFQGDNTVRYSRIGTLILETEGVLDYSGLTVNGGTANINIPLGSVAVLGVVSFS